jgi:hypothetical protein
MIDERGVIVHDVAVGVDAIQALCSEASKLIEQIVPAFT